MSYFASAAPATSTAAPGLSGAASTQHRNTDRVNRGKGGLLSSTPLRPELRRNCGCNDTWKELRHLQRKDIVETATRLRVNKKRKGVPNAILEVSEHFLNPLRKDASPLSAIITPLASFCPTRPSTKRNRFFLRWR